MAVSSSLGGLSSSSLAVYSSTLLAECALRSLLHELTLEVEAKVHIKETACLPHRASYMKLDPDICKIPENTIFSLYRGDSDPITQRKDIESPAPILKHQKISSKALSTSRGYSSFLGS